MGDRVGQDRAQLDGPALTRPRHQSRGTYAPPVATCYPRRQLPHTQVSEPVKVRPSIPVALTENDPPVLVITAGTRNTPASVVTSPETWRHVTAIRAG